MAISLRKAYVQREYRDSDGYWIELRTGYQCGDDPGTHGIVEDTKTRAYSRLRSVIPCACDECTARKAARAHRK